MQTVFSEECMVSIRFDRVSGGNAQPAPSQPAQEASQAGKVALAILALTAGIAVKLFFVLLEVLR